MRGWTEPPVSPFKQYFINVMNIIKEKEQRIFQLEKELNVHKAKIISTLLPPNERFCESIVEEIISNAVVKALANKSTRANFPQNEETSQKLLHELDDSNELKRQKLPLSKSENNVQTSGLAGSSENVIRTSLTEPIKHRSGSPADFTSSRDGDYAARFQSNPMAISTSRRGSTIAEPLQGSFQIKEAPKWVPGMIAFCIQF